MAYEKQTWKTGDVITQEKLNHMEDGIAGGGDSPVLIVELEHPAVSGGSSTASATFDEIVEAMDNGKFVVAKVLNMPKQYGNQFDYYYSGGFYDYGATSDDTYLTFYRIPETHLQIRCSRDSVWTNV